MRATLLFPLLLLASLSLQIDKFHFHGHLTCKYQKRWCWRVDAWEHDYLDPNDHLGGDGKCTDHPVAAYSVHGSADGDGPISFVYELGIVVIHSCVPPNSPEKNNKIQALWTVEANVGKEYVFEKNITLPHD